MALAMLPYMPGLQEEALAAEWDGTTIASSYDGGSGTLADPYQIATAEQLAYMETQVTTGASQGGVYFVLTDDIDLGSKPWKPIGRTPNGFRGSFDGAGHTISNLYFNDSAASEVGLFGAISRGGVIKNLGLVDVDITADMWVGGLVGHEVAISGNIAYPEIIIEECFVTGSITANEYVGGIISNFGYGQMKNCYTNCTVTALVSDARLGGICYGLGGYSTMENCYAAGEIKAPNGSGGLVGGLAAVANAYSTMSNSAGLNPSVSGNWGVARLVSGFQSTPITLSNNRGFADMSVKINDVDKSPLENALDGRDGADVTAAEVLDPNFWVNDMGWDSSVWIFAAGKLPLLSGFSATQPDTLPVHIAIAPTVTTTALANGTVAKVYSQTLTATGTSPITWALDSGNLPSGLTLNAATGVIAGTPTTAGTATFTVEATNIVGNNTKQLSIKIDDASSGLSVDTPVKLKVKFNANGGKAGKAKTKYGKVIKAAAVYVRKAPSSHGNSLFVVGHLKKGQTFKVKGFINKKGTSKDWYRLTYKGKTAYVYAKYVKVIYK